MTEQTTPEAPEHSPECSKPEPEVGFGLAGGGFGSYTYCPECFVILWKGQEE